MTERQTKDSIQADGQRIIRAWRLARLRNDMKPRTPASPSIRLHSSPKANSMARQRTENTITVSIRTVTTTTSSTRKILREKSLTSHFGGVGGDRSQFILRDAGCEKNVVSTLWYYTIYHGKKFCAHERRWRRWFDDFGPWGLILFFYFFIFLFFCFVCRERGTKTSTRGGVQNVFWFSWKTMDIII